MVGRELAKEPGLRGERRLVWFWINDLSLTLFSLALDAESSLEV